MNRARTLHEATQLALDGHKVLVSCPCVEPELAEALIEGTASTFLLYDTPKKCVHEPNGPGWAVRFRDHGEVFFSPFYSEEDRYFDYLFTLRSVDEVRAEIIAKGIFPTKIPIEWHPAVSLMREPLRIPSRYERIQANMGALWVTSL